jgi:hypothetical protein
MEMASLFEIALRDGGTVRLHTEHGQLDALRDEIAAAGLLPPPEHRPGCRRWGLGDVIAGAVWLVLLAVLATVRR